MFPGNHILTEQTMHRKTSPAVFVFFALVGCFAFAAHAATSPAVSAAKAGSANQGRRQEYIKVMEAARRDAPAFLALIPEGRESGFGFGNHQEIAGAIIGDAYQVLTLSPEFIQGEPVPAGKELVEAGEWWVTVRNGERNALVMIVALVESDWQVVAMGMTNQAMELASFEKSSKDRQENIQILRIYTLQADFILSVPAGGFPTPDGDLSVPDGGSVKGARTPDTKVYPMMTARKAFPGALEKSAFSLDELLQWLRIQFMQL